jgi:hypothetical protein
MNAVEVRNNKSEYRYEILISLGSRFESWAAHF